MERTEREIVDRFKKYAAEPAAIEAAADILLFMGIPEAADFAAQAMQEVEQEKSLDRVTRAEYRAYISQGSRFYISYEEFCRRKEAGAI